VGAHTGFPEYEKAGPEAAAAAIAKIAGEARQFGARALAVSHSGLSAAGEFSGASSCSRWEFIAGRQTRSAG